MSDALYFTRLRWVEGCGVAKYHGRSVKLDSAPDILGLLIVELIYTPEMAVGVVRETRAPLNLRELRPNEIAACDAFLRRTVLHPGET